MNDVQSAKPEVRSKNFHEKLPRHVRSFCRAPAAGGRAGPEPRPLMVSLRKWWQDPELNRGHKDFQSSALPTELSCQPSFPPSALVSPVGTPLIPRTCG